MNGLLALGAWVLAGLGALLVPAAFWAILQPFRAAELFARGLKHVGWLGRAVRRKTIALGVEGNVNRMLDEEVFAQIARDRSVPAPRLRLRMVKEPQDARMLNDGSIIVRMRDEGDSTRNVLRVIRVAAPMMFGADVRPYLEEEFKEAVDLQVVRRIARRLGPQAERIFATDFLEPAGVGKRPNLATLLKQLHEVDEGGLFTSVLLQELDFVSMRARSNPPDVKTFQQETVSFVDKLHWLATRQPGDEREDLALIGKYYRVGFILLARKAVAKKGPPPYVRRLHIKVRTGCESVYLLCLTDSQASFFIELVKAFEREQIVTVEHRYDLATSTGERRRIALLRRTDFAAAPMSFAEVIENYGIEPGLQTTALVTSVGRDRASLSIEGVPAEMLSTDIDWGYTGTASRFLEGGREINVVITQVDEDRHMVRAGTKWTTLSPWEDVLRAPVEGQRVKFQVGGVHDDRLLVYLPDKTMWGLMLKADWPLPKELVPHWDQLIEKEYDGVIVHADSGRDYVRVSRRDTAPIDWVRMRDKYPNGSSAIAHVLSIESDGLMLELEPGIAAWLNYHDLEAVGREWTNWRENIMPGQGIEVVVRQFQAGRKRFLTELDRSRWQ